MVPRKTVGIIGSNGFVGSNLFHDLSHKFECFGITKDNFDKVDKKFDILINANGNSNKRLSITDPLLDFDLTVRNTLISTTKFEYDTYIYISSCEIYNDIFNPEKTKEDSEIEISKISKYALSKYLAENIVKNHCKKHLILRLSTPVGKGLKKGPIYDILHGDKLWMSPESKLQILHTNFISKFILKLIQEEIMNETINLVGNDPIGLLDIICFFSKKIDYPGNPVVLHNINNVKANNIMQVPSSIEAVKILGGFYET